jgi:hypothetical protein
MDGNGRERTTSTEDVLAAWRAASREVDQARQTLEMAAMAALTAEQSERMAQDIVDVTQTAMEASAHARASAKAAAEAATDTRQRVEAHRADARAKLEAAIIREGIARERYHQAQGRAFERYRHSTEVGAPDPYRQLQERRPFDRSEHSTDAEREPEASGAG